MRTTFLLTLFLGLTLLLAGCAGSTEQKDSKTPGKPADTQKEESKPSEGS